MKEKNDEDHAHAYRTLAIKNFPDSEIEIEAEIPSEEMERYWTTALESFKQRAELPGFRPGKAPESVVLEKFGEMKILEEAAEMAMQEAYPHIVKHENLDILGRPNISVLKLARGNPLLFKITAVVFPSFALTNYKETAKLAALKKEVTEVSEKEIEDTITAIRKESAKRTATKNGEEEKLSELNDEFVKTIGKFDSVVDFRSKVTQGLKREKEYRAKEKTRLEIIEGIIKNAEIPVPKILLEDELQKMWLQFQDDIGRMGQKPDEYLKRIGKTEKELRDLWEDAARDRVKLDLVLDKIATEEKISPAPEEIEKEVLHIMEHHSGADRERARAYAAHVIRKEKVFEFLEGQK